MPSLVHMSTSDFCRNVKCSHYILATRLSVSTFISYFAFCLEQPINIGIIFVRGRTIKSLSVSFKSQLPLNAELGKGSDPSFPPLTANSLQPTAGNSALRGEVYSSHSHSPSLSLPMIFFTLFLWSVFRVALFILTSQPVNLRSLDSHLSAGGHRGVEGLLASLCPLQILHSLLSCRLCAALPAGLKAPQSLPLIFSPLSFSLKCWWTENYMLGLREGCEAGGSEPGRGDTGRKKKKREGGKTKR